MTSRSSRIFYVGMVCTEAYVTAIREEAFIGAAAGKMSAVVSALRVTGRRAVLVSLPYVGRGPSRQSGRISRSDGFPAFFLPTLRAALPRKLYGFFAFAWFAKKKVRRQDKVLFYNHSFEYLLALAILRMRGIAVFQDIEDVPAVADSGLRGAIDRLGFRMMFALASPRKVTVSNQVGRNLALIDFLPIQGIAAADHGYSAEEKWQGLAAGGPLRVHFGGTLVAATGVDLFCAALRYLELLVQRLDREISFIVTGTGDFEKIRSLIAELRSGRVNLVPYQEIDRRGYFSLLDSCHASLSLKSPESELADTTFPSKVIEITSRGLALVATNVSDVGDIFADDVAWLLQRSDSKELAEIFLEMAAHPDEVRRRAEAGQARARELFAPLTVGRTLAAFLEAGPPPR